MAGRKHCKDKRSNLRSPNLIGAIWAIRDDLDDVMETSLTIDYDKQRLNYVFAIGHQCFHAIVSVARRLRPCIMHALYSKEQP